MCRKPDIPVLTITEDESNNKHLHHPQLFFFSSTHVVDVARLQVWLSLTVLCFHLSQNCPCPAWRRIGSTGDAEVSYRCKEKGDLHQVEALGAHSEVTVLNLNISE
jgi:hypothetical protein